MTTEYENTEIYVQVAKDVYARRVSNLDDTVLKSYATRYNNGLSSDKSMIPTTSNLIGAALLSFACSAVLHASPYMGSVLLFLAFLEHGIRIDELRCSQMFTHKKITLNGKEIRIIIPVDL